MPGPPVPDPRAWRPPEGWTEIVAVDAHTEGEPLRVVLSGFPEPLGPTILERRRDARDRLDHLRTALMWEPRGHADMYGCIVVPAERPGSDFGVLFTHNAGYSTMCGHGVLAVARVAVDFGLVARREPSTRIVVDTPAGPVAAAARVEGGAVTAVSFRNVPSWASGLDREVDVPGLGRIRYDLAFGGAFYAYVDAQDAGVGLEPSHVPRLIERGMAIKEAVAGADVIEHPSAPELGFLYGTIFTGPPRDPAHHSRNVCIFADGEVDRSPTGTGVSGRLALLRARGEVEVGETVVIESVIGSRFACRVVEDVEAAGRAAVVPEVEGRVHVTGVHRFLLDPGDPFRHGFLVR